jgi:hypothetical protein
MFESKTSSGVNRQAAIAGSAEFFAPLIRICPSSLAPPVIFSLSTVVFVGDKDRQDAKVAKRNVLASWRLGGFSATGLC